MCQSSDACTSKQMGRECWAADGERTATKAVARTGPNAALGGRTAASGDGRGVAYYRWLAISREGCVLDGVGGAGKLDCSLPARVVLIDPAARRSSR
jgi:hypothetical protein